MNYSHFDPSTAMTFNKIEPMRYTKHMDQCLNGLTAAAEYESDKVLVELVRSQHLSDRIYRFNSRNDLVDELPGIPITPVGVYREAFKVEIDRLRVSLSANLKSNCEFGVLLYNLHMRSTC